MSHAIRHLDYHCSVSKRQILKDINSFAYDPQETSGYHGNLTWHEDKIYPNRDEAMEAIEKYDNGWYSDHAVRYRDSRRVFWLVKVEYHC